MGKKNGLTTRQYRLHDYLLSRFSDGSYISKKEICEALPQYYDWNTNHTRMCRIIEDDVHAINSDVTIQKIIVSNRTGYKIGTREEVETYLAKRFLRDWKSIKLSRHMAKKVALDGQMTMVFNSEREFIETFIRGE
jgi:hypothetical protein